MLQKLNLFVLLFLCFTFQARGEKETIILKNANIIDVINGNTTYGYVVIEDGIISKLGEDDGDKLKGEHVDLQGAYIIPGLIDAHVHIANDPNESQESRIKHLNYFIEHGITTVRDAAGDARVLKELKEMVKSGAVNGPDIYYAAFIAGPSYYKDNDREKDMVQGWGSEYAPWLQCVGLGDKLDEAMLSAKSCGATGIKIYGGYDGDFLPQLVDAANKHNLEAWGHATLYPAKPFDVAKAGVKVMSHAYLFEWENVKEELKEDIFENYRLFYDKIDRENIDTEGVFELMMKNNIIFDVTLYLCMVNGMEWSADIVKKAHKKGIKICAGTDYINDLKRPYPYLFDEIELYVKKCEFTPLDAIRSATIIAAETVGEQKTIGSINIGKRGNIVVLSKNPLDNIEHLKTITMVIKDGHIMCPSGE